MAYQINKYNSNIKIIEQLGEDYDVIFSFDVMEHISNYKEVFEDLFKRLKIGGLCIIGYHFTPKGEEGRPGHYEESYPVHKMFKENNFELIPPNIWRKIK
ncbi:MAG: class I SAM-dependent methyltransferase [Halanaerobiales bacterium]|nr:class I SAM-dependent methyltransferase [Halanaerobiales bacterium]